VTETAKLAANGRLLGLLASVLVILWPATAADRARKTIIAEVTPVRDGETIVVGSMPIRLNGLAAPEGDEPGGAEATKAMLELVQGRTLRCELDGERTGDRCVGICYFEGKDISEVMAHCGVARDCPRFSQGRYAKAERQAAAAGATIGRAIPSPGIVGRAEKRDGD
jgi:micrococcal nuclease